MLGWTANIDRMPAWLVAFVLAVSAWPAATAAQAQGPGPDLEVRLQDAELGYATANGEWTTALAAFRAAESRWQRALDEVQQLDDSGDQEALERAYGRFHSQAIELATQEAREQDTARRLAESRSSLMEVLALSRDQFYEEALEAETPEQTRELAALYQDRHNRYLTLEQEGAPPQAITLVTLPEIDHDPRDGPAELEGKIRLLELRMREIDVQIELVDERVAALERQRRQERDLQNLMSGVERFDDTFLPVTSPDPLSDTTDRDRDSAATPSDSTDVSLDDLSVDQQIEGLRLLREQMFERRGHIDNRAAGFRQRLRRMTTS